jgi:hypothetical protein
MNELNQEQDELAVWKRVPLERTYDMRARAIIAFNQAEHDGKDRDDALDAAWKAMLAATPSPPASLMPSALGVLAQQSTYLREILQDARSVVARGWTKGCSARDKEDRPVNPNLVNGAEKWSAFGAISVAEVNLLNRAIGALNFGQAEVKREAVYAAGKLALILLADATGATSGYAQHRINAWNDSDATKKADVIAAFDRLIAAMTVGREG